MKTLYIERSTGECRDGSWVEKLDLEGVERIVVGTGPGSFAGIRSALAFAQGYALGKKCEVLGLPSPCAVAAQFYKEQLPSSTSTSHLHLAVLGDARQGKIWIALFDGYRLEKDVFQVGLDDVCKSVLADYKVVTTDAGRIDGALREMFGNRYCGGRIPTCEGLRAFAESNPAILTPEPRPIYLNPAVRAN